MRARHSKARKKILLRRLARRRGYVSYRYSWGDRVVGISNTQLEQEWR